MSQIKVARYSGVKYEFVDGYARVPVLEGEFDQAHFAHCALQPGCSITPEVYSVTEHNQLFIFTKGKGYVTTPRQAWNIREPGVFVPEFDAERFTITCSADSKQPLEFLHIITELSDYDKTCLVESRMVSLRAGPTTRISRTTTPPPPLCCWSTATWAVCLWAASAAPAPSRSDSTSTTSWPSGISPCPAPSSSTPPAARK